LHGGNNSPPAPVNNKRINNENESPSVLPSFVVTEDGQTMKKAKVAKIKKDAIVFNRAAVNPNSAAPLQE
jgi:hypothetical protein